MMEFLLIPPVAFVVYLALVSLLTVIGRALAGEPPPSSLVKSNAYASGEDSVKGSGAPGYRPFIRTALFFAVLHLGVLVLASGGFSGTAALYLIGLIVALMALIVG